MQGREWRATRRATLGGRLPWLPTPPDRRAATQGLATKDKWCYRQNGSGTRRPRSRGPTIVVGRRPPQAPPDFATTGTRRTVALGTRGYTADRSTSGRRRRRARASRPRRERARGRHGSTDSYL